MSHLETYKWASLAGDSREVSVREKAAQLRDAAVAAMTPRESAEAQMLVRDWREAAQAFDGRAAALESPAVKPAPETPAAMTVKVPNAPSGYEALGAGRLAEATAAFDSVAQAHRGDFSVQLFVACSPQTFAKAIQNDSSTELFILPATIASKPCHRLMRGFYKTSGEAERAVLDLPAYYVAEGVKPKPVAVRAVLP